MLPLLLACLRPAPGLNPGPKVSQQGERLRALVLSDCAGVASLAEGSTVTLPAKEGQVLRVHAQSAWIPIPPEVSDWDEGFPIYLVEGSDGTGWISGEHLAIEQTWESTGWQGEVPYKRDVGAHQWWAAAREGRQWSEKMAEWDRPVSEGWWVREGPEGTERVALTDSNGWGSTHTLRSVIWRDLTGDGEDEAIVLRQETATEYGSVGHTLHIFDLTQGVAPLLVLPLHDPHWTGMDLVDRWGWAELDLPAQQLRQVYAEREGEAGDRGTLAVTEVTWTWESGTLVEARRETSHPGAQISAGPSYPQPETFGEDHRQQEGVEVPAQTACILGVSGPVATGDETWFQAGDCETGAPLFWVPTQRVTWAQAPFNQFFGPWPEHEETLPPLQVTWR